MELYLISIFVFSEDGYLPSEVDFLKLHNKTSDLDIHKVLLVLFVIKVCS